MIWQDRSLFFTRLKNRLSVCVLSELIGWRFNFDQIGVDDDDEERGGRERLRQQLWNAS